MSSSFDLIKQSSLHLKTKCFCSGCLTQTVELLVLLTD